MESIFLVDAGSDIEACEKASCLALEECQPYENTAGEIMNVVPMGVAGCFCLDEEVMAGSEIFSRFLSVQEATSILNSDSLS